MTKEEEYRQAAMTSLKLAETGSPSEKVRMLLLAEAWFKLAERRAQSQEHPLPLRSTVLGGPGLGTELKERFE